MAVAGGLLLASTFAPWSDRGSGSSIALRRVGDLVLSGAVDAWAPRWVGLVVYAIPLGGALLLVGAGLGSRRGLTVGTAGTVAALAGGVVVVLALDRLGRAGVGPGTVMAAAGTVVAAIGLATAARIQLQGDT